MAEQQTPTQRRRKSVAEARRRRQGTTPTSVPKEDQSTWESIGGLPGAAAAGVRGLSGLLSVGGAQGAAMSGGGEVLAQLIEALGGIGQGQSFGQRAARVGTEAGIGAVPLAKWLKTGRSVTNFLKGAGLGAGGDLARQAAEQGEFIPDVDLDRTVVAGTFGGGAAALGQKLADKMGWSLGSDGPTKTSAEQAKEAAEARLRAAKLQNRRIGESPTGQQMQAQLERAMRQQKVSDVRTETKLETGFQSDLEKALRAALDKASPTSPGFEPSTVIAEKAGMIPGAPMPPSPLASVLNVKPRLVKPGARRPADTSYVSPQEGLQDIDAAIKRAAVESENARALRRIEDAQEGLEELEPTVTETLKARIPGGSRSVQRRWVPKEEDNATTVNLGDDGQLLDDAGRPIGPPPSGAGAGEPPPPAAPAAPPKFDPRSLPREAQEDFFLLNWLADDLDQMPFEPGGSLLGQRRAAFEDWRPGDPEHLKHGFVPAGRVPGTPVYHMLESLGIGKGKNYGEKAALLKQMAESGEVDDNLYAVVDVLRRSFDPAGGGWKAMRKEGLPSELRSILMSRGIEPKDIRLPMSLPKEYEDRYLPFLGIIKKYLGSDPDHAGRLFDKAGMEDIPRGRELIREFFRMGEAGQDTTIANRLNRPGRETARFDELAEFFGAEGKKLNEGIPTQTPTVQPTDIGNRPTVTPQTQGAPQGVEGLPPQPGWSPELMNQRTLRNLEAMKAQMARDLDDIDLAMPTIDDSAARFEQALREFEAAGGFPAPEGGPRWLRENPPPPAPPAPVAPKARGGKGGAAPKEPWPEAGFEDVEGQDFFAAYDPLVSAAETYRRNMDLERAGGEFPGALKKLLGRALGREKKAAGLPGNKPIPKGWRRPLSDQKGAASTEFQLNLLSALMGGATGAVVGQETDENPILGGLLGAGAGFLGPHAIRKAFQNTPPAPLGQEIRETVKSPNDIRESLISVVERLPNAQRSNLLSSGEGLFSNALLGPYGSALTGAGEAALAGDPRGRQALKEVWNPFKFARDMANREIYDEAAYRVAKGESGRTDWGAASAQPSTVEGMMMLPGVAMTAGDLVGSNALQRAGFSAEEARKMMLTSEPETGLFRHIVNFGRGTPRSTADRYAKALAGLMAPFRRTPSNIVEQGIPRIPVVGALGQMAVGDADMAQIAAQQAISIPLSYGAYQLGEELDPETARSVRRMVSNIAGRYSLPVSTAFVLGHSAGQGRPVSPERLVEDALPLPAVDPLRDVTQNAMALFGQAEPVVPRGAYPAQVRDIFRKPSNQGPPRPSRSRRPKSVRERRQQRGG